MQRRRPLPDSATPPRSLSLLLLSILLGALSSPLAAQLPASNPSKPSAAIPAAQPTNSFTNTDAALSKWAATKNPFYDGPWSDLLSLIPYVLLCGFLFLVAREKLLAPRRNTPVS